MEKLCDKVVYTILHNNYACTKSNLTLITDAMLACIMNGC